MKRIHTTRLLAANAILAALYAVVTILTAPLSYGLANFRLSEALIVLCCFEPSLYAGIILGCFLANFFSTVTALDIVVGTLATVIACALTARCHKPWLIPLPNVLVNGILVGAMLAAVLFPNQLVAGFLLAFVQVSFGEAVVMYGLGVPLYLFLRRGDLVSKLLKKQ